MDAIVLNIAPAERARLEAVYKAEGLTLQDAVNMFFEQSILTGGMPFAFKNAETKAAIQEAREIIAGCKSVKNYKSARELFDELDAEIEAEDAGA